MVVGKRVDKTCSGPALMHSVSAVGSEAARRGERSGLEFLGPCGSGGSVAGIDCRRG